MKHIILSLCFLGMTLIATAQNQRTITGTVADESGEPLIGATVKVPGTSTGTITDLDGHYTITLPVGAASLQVSYVGYKQQIVKVKGGKVDFVMRDDTNVLDEMVVIGYGSVKKGNITNSVASVKGDQLADRPVSNIASALQGELAGVEVRTTSGAPGSGVQINVRGATSINEEGSSNPLYVVDGVPMDDDFDLIDLNPQDIESIEVLKDASSSAIYGSRGANGVVIITSKKGQRNGKTNVSFTAGVSISTPERYVDIMSPSEWIAWRTKANNLRYVNNYAARGASLDDDYDTRVATIGSASVNYVNDPRWTMPGYGGLALIDWQKEIFQNALAKNYNLSVSSGNKDSFYRASVGLVNQDGIVIHTGFKRVNVKINGETTVKNRLTLGFDIAPQFSVTKGGNVDGKGNMAQLALTTAPVAEPDAGVYTGSQPYSFYRWASSAVSPVASMEQATYRDEQVRINSSAFARLRIMDGLQAEVLGSWNFNNRSFRRFSPSTLNRYWKDYPEGYYSTSRWTGNRSHKFLLQATATYDHDFGLHHLNAVAGWSIELTKWQSNYTINASQFPNNAVQSFNMNDVELTDVNATLKTDDRMVSYFARVGYSYADRYLVNASMRRDGSSRFGTNRRWGTFPAVSAAWRINNEPFWNKAWAMNQAKLRVSYGVNGSNAIPINSAVGLLESSNYSNGSTLQNGFVPSSSDNPDLGWQKTHSWDIGVDLAFLNNRISLAADYYVKTIKDMLYQITLPADMGYTRGYTNVGNIRNTGLELELKTENLAGKLRWTTTLALGFNRNRVKSLGANSRIFTGYDKSTQVIEVGHTAGEYYMYDAVGVYQTQEELDKYPKQSSSVLGGVRYRDVNGDGVITETDRTYLGHPQPSATYGMTNTFRWKNWDFSFPVTAQTGGKIYGALGRAFDRQGMGKSVNVLKKWKNMWFSEEDPGDGHTPNAWSSSKEEYDNRWLYSSDFIKLKNVTLGYKLKFPNKAFVNSLRTAFSVENVFMIDSYDGGYSPESNNSPSRISSYDYGAYPMARTYSFTVNVQF